MTHRSAARVVGILFILATVPFSISVMVLEPILGSPEFLARVAENPARTGVGVLLEMVNHLAVVGIAVIIFPVLKPFSERMALGYVVARSIEATLFAVATLHLLTLVFLAGEVGSADAGPQAQLMADVLLAGHDWNTAVLPFTAFGLGAMLLNYALYRARLVPRWIAVFGLLSAASILGARLLLIAGVSLAPSTVIAMDGPIFLQEMVFAAWLIFRGFGKVSEASSLDTGGTEVAH